MTRLFNRCVILLIFVLPLIVESNFFKQFEEYVKNEESRRAQDVLESDLLGSVDSPKEIEIHCPQVIILL